jgi:hypothetical protein
MLDVLYTDDDDFHQAIMLRDGNEQVRVVIEKFIAKKSRMVSWEWMVWAMTGPLRTFHGSAASLSAAEFDALAAGFEMVDDMAVDQAGRAPLSGRSSDFAGQTGRFARGPWPDSRSSTGKQQPGARRRSLAEDGRPEALAVASGRSERHGVAYSCPEPTR